MAAEGLQLRVGAKADRRSYSGLEKVNIHTSSRSSYDPIHSRRRRDDGGVETYHVGVGSARGEHAVGNLLQKAVLRA